MKNAFILKHHKFREDFFYVDYVKKDIEFKSQRQLSRNENEVFIMQEPVLLEMNQDEFRRLLKQRISKAIDFNDIVIDEVPLSGRPTGLNPAEKTRKGYWPVIVLQNLSQESYHDGLMNIFSKPQLFDDFDQFSVGNPSPSNSRLQRSRSSF